MTIRVQLATAPKTGSSWLSEALRQFDSKLVKAGGNRHDVTEGRPFADKAFIFATIRNPFTWLPSFFNYCSRSKKWSVPMGPTCIMGFPQYDTWDAFVESITARPRIVEYGFTPYLQKATHVLYNERIAEDTIAALKSIGANGDYDKVRSLAPYNVTQSRRDSSWTEEQVKGLLESEKGFIERWYPDLTIENILES